MWPQTIHSLTGFSWNNNAVFFYISLYIDLCKDKVSILWFYSCYRCSSIRRYFRDDVSCTGGFQLASHVNNLKLTGVKSMLTVLERRRFLITDDRTSQENLYNRVSLWYTWNWFCFLSYTDSDATMQELEGSDKYCGTLSFYRVPGWAPRLASSFNSSGVWVAWHRIRAKSKSFEGDGEIQRNRWGDGEPANKYKRQGEDRYLGLILLQMGTKSNIDQPIRDHFKSISRLLFKASFHSLLAARSSLLASHCNSQPAITQSLRKRLLYIKVGKLPFAVSAPKIADLTILLHKRTPA